MATVRNQTARLSIGTIPEPIGKPISRVITIGAGLGLTIVIAAILSLVSSIWIDIDLIARAIWLAITLLFFYIPGFVKVVGETKEDGEIDVNFYGIPLLLDSPLRFYLPVGWSWLLPYVMKIKSIDMRVQTVNIPPEDGSGEPFIINSISSFDINLPGGRKATKFVPLLCKVVYEFVVIDAYQYYRQKPAVIEKVLVSAISEAMRAIAATGSYGGVTIDMDHGRADFELMGKADELSTALTMDIKQMALRSWGIEILNVYVRSIVPQSARLKEHYEDVPIQQAEREAREIESTQILDYAKQIMAANPGMEAGHAMMWASSLAGDGVVETINMIGKNDKNPIWLAKLPIPGQTTPPTTRPPTTNPPTT